MYNPFLQYSESNNMPNKKPSRTKTKPTSVILQGQWEHQLRNDPCLFAFSFSQPQASAVCWLQTLKFTMPIELKYEGPVWLVASEVYDEKCLGEELCGKLTKFLDPKYLKLKHIIGRIYVDSVPTGELESTVEVKDSLPLEYDLPYDDRDRKFCK